MWLEVAESVGHEPKTISFGYCTLIKNFYTRNTSNARKREGGGGVWLELLVSASSVKSN